MKDKWTSLLLYKANIRLENGVATEWTMDKNFEAKVEIKLL